MLKLISQDFMGFTGGALGPGEQYGLNTPTKLTLSSYPGAKVLSFKVARQDSFGPTITISAAGDTLAVIGGISPDYLVGQLFEIQIRGFRVEDVTVTCTGRCAVLVTLLAEVDNGAAV